MCVWLVATIGSHSLKRVAEPLKCELVVIYNVCLHAYNVLLMYSTCTLYIIIIIFSAFI